MEQPEPSARSFPDFYDQSPLVELSEPRRLDVLVLLASIALDPSVTTASCPWRSPRFRQWLLSSIDGTPGAILHDALDVDFAWLRRVVAPWASKIVSTSPGKNREPFERLLEVFAPGIRREHGVFFTPRALARYAIEQVQRSLHQDFQLSQGLLDSTPRHKLGLGDQRTATDPFVQILDPAMGIGVFIEECIAFAHRQFQSEENSQASWSEYFATGLAPRLQGLDLFPAPIAMAAFRVGQILAQTGYDFDIPCQLAFRQADALRFLMKNQDRQRFSVIIGNPPFRSLAPAPSGEMVDLMHGRKSGRGGQRSYFRVDAATDPRQEDLALRSLRAIFSDCTLGNRTGGRRTVGINYQSRIPDQSRLSRNALSAAQFV